MDRIEPTKIPFVKEAKRVALDRALVWSRQRAGATSAREVVEVAKEFENYLKGESDG